uniref:Olfactory receptor n=1 Tax=Pelusios castaneus TaxID=367368 RepID=A0A8C8STM9_9SAUR
RGLLNVFTTETPPVFLLVGVPGLETVQHWIAVPLCSMYILAVLGNCLVLFVIRTEPKRHLHRPMYYFLSMLAATDLGLALSTLPTVLNVLWFSAREISISACLIQMTFIHGFSYMESSVLLAMAFDRYVAICNPLRYTSILTSSRIARAGVAIVSRSIFVLVPLICLFTQLPFCRSRVLSYSYCLHQDVIRLACADTTFNSLYGFTLSLFIMVLDPLLIVLSYIKIIKMVLSITSKEEHPKTLSTCVSHICAVLIFYVPMVGWAIIRRFGENTAPVIHVLMVNLYLFVPPVLNPIIYSMKTKEIREGILKIFRQKKF